MCSAFGEVWVVEDKYSLDLKAMKKIINEKHIGSLKREVEHLKSITSSFVVEYYDAIEEGNELKARGWG